MRLIDANELLEDIESSKENHGMVQIIADMLTRYVKRVPIIDPETLPIVRELREELERAKAERDSYKIFFEDITKCGDSTIAGNSQRANLSPKSGKQPVTTARYGRDGDHS